MILIGFCIALLLGLLVGAMVVGPWLGWNVALAYLYRRFCVHAVDPDTHDLDAWDRALGEAHEESFGGIWREMLLEADPRQDQETEVVT